MNTEKGNHGYIERTQEPVTQRDAAVLLDVLYDIRHLLFEIHMTQPRDNS